MRAGSAEGRGGGRRFTSDLGSRREVREEVRTKDVSKVLKNDLDAANFYIFPWLLPLFLPHRGRLIRNEKRSGAIRETNHPISQFDSIISLYIDLSLDPKCLNWSPTDTWRVCWEIPKKLQKEEKNVFVIVDRPILPQSPLKWFYWTF